MHNEYLEPLWEAFSTYADYPAIVDQDGTRSTSYTELCVTVRRVMAWFESQKLEPGQFVPVILPQSMEYLACEIGIWFSGHSAVPMGPAFPPDRISYICEHCEAPLVIDEATWKDIAACEPLNCDTPPYPPEELPALLIYTSGSTGNPKGILHSFKGLATKHTAKVALTYSPADHWGMGAPLYFVASLTCYKVLKEGGQLHLFHPDTYRDMTKLENYIIEHGITHTFLSPSMLAVFHNRSESLKLVFTGSERLSNQASRDGYVLLNCYGMTETGGTVSAFKVSHPYETTPVGKPEEEWCLLNEDGTPVEPGEEGELCLRGVYCDGYYKDPERTAELYRGGWLHTNDILRQLPDGNLVYVNRKDWMAKINGQRVEPGEVENAIAKLDGVNQAVVKAFENDGGSQYLCAFFTGDADPDSLRSSLEAKLPPYMVPSFFVPVQKFALLPNGKVNRKVLAAPSASSLRSSYVAPATELEHRLCDAFAELFGLEQVGAEDDFFLLGGDSVRVMRLQQLLEDLPMSAKIVAEARTPRAIAAALAGVAAQNVEPRYERTALSQTQLGIYTESMARAGEAVYNNPVLLKLDPTLDEERLANAINAAVEAHRSICGHVEEDEGGTPMLVYIPGAYRQPVERMTDDEFEAVKPQLIQPFNLQKGPLFRIRIIRTPTSLYLFFDFQHLIFDGTSMRVFMADVNAAYAGESVQAERYTGLNVAFDEAQARASEQYEQARAWHEENFGKLDLNSVPQPDRAGDEVTFASFDFTLRASRPQADLFCKRLGVTENVLAVAAFGRALGAFTNAREVLFPTIYNGRADLRCARTVSMMVKTLALHLGWEATTSVADFLAATKVHMLTAMSYDLFSFAENAELSGVTSDVLFAYQGDYLALGEVAGKPFERVELEGNATGSPLDVQLFIKEGEFVLHVEYQSNRYSEDFVNEFARCYDNVLAGLMEVERLCDIALVDSEQLERLESFHGTAVEYDREATVVSMFRAAAMRWPSNVAAICGKRQLNYVQLNELSDRLAATIAGLGAHDSGDVVSILIPRGLWMPAAALGSLKAGCAYQPLDATYPPERLNFMLKDAQAKLLITTPELRDIVTDYQGDVLLVDEDVTQPWQLLRGDGSAEADGNLHPGANDKAEPRDPQPEDLFILLYTSGTTGVPKGVRLTHGNLSCFVDWYRRYYGLNVGHRVAAYASFGFDACMMDMYPALSCGAGVVIVPEDMRLDLISMGQYLENNGVTHAFMTTQVGRQFAVDVKCATLEHLSMGGETLVPFNVPARPTCYNCYGPTECTIFSTVYQLEGGERSYPIGRPLDNMRAYIVDADGKRLPVGAEGELWLSGPQVGDGYLNRPEKTAEVFGSDPFAKDGMPLYRTGDVVRWMPDGNIEFIGRRDTQVKIRGFRIELSEVEAVVREFPGVRDATVAAFDHPSGGKFVAAYVVSDEPVNTEALADFIRERKPPYMVPAAVVQLERIPLNQNSKVNRRALPVPDLSASAAGDEVDDSRPLNALESALSEIAAEIVGTDAFGVSTPLAQVGLSSIQGIRLLTLIYKRLGVRISAQEAGNDVSVAKLENLILARWMAGDVQAKAEEQAPRGPFRAPLTFAQEGVYYECLKHPHSLAYNIPSLISFAEGVSPDDVARAASAFAAAHPALLARFDQTDGEIALVKADVEFSVEQEELSEAAFAALRENFVRPFDLAQGPLCRFEVVSVGGRVFLLSDFHHLAFDGASMGIFLSELSAALGGEAIEPESYSYANYAQDQRTFAASAGFEQNRAYLAELLSDFETASELPADLSGREAGGHQAIAQTPFDLARVEAACKACGATPASFMLAATSYALARYANDRTVYLATISNGRSDVRTSQTVGMFVNTLPLAVKLADVTVAEFVKRCAQTLTAAIGHEAYPFARVASDYGFAPQVMYEYQLGAVDAQALDGGALSSVEGLAPDEAKFKLAVHIELVDGAPSIVAYYNDALYSAGLMEGFVRSVAIVCDALLSQADAPVRSISLVDDARAAQLAAFHEEAEGPADFKLYHEGLERQAKLHPDATALVACDGSFTFAQLNAYSNRIAHALIARGVEPGSRVALLLGRTSRVIMAMFGVMKAACAYIPCDPAYPQERVNHILQDSEAPLVITDAAHVDSYEGAVDVEELLGSGAAGAANNESNPNLPQDPSSLAYLIYTSGSTGKPKGVMLTHAGVCNFHSNHPSNILVDELVRKAHAFLAVTTLSFDMSVKEVGTPLVNGLTLVLASENQINDPAALAALAEQTGADAFNATHSRLKQYLDSPAFSAFIARCQVVLSGGEKYSQGLLPLLQRTTSATIINTYGPTETTVSSNMADLTHATRITVGRPLYNVWECVVDADGNELPEGIVGELLIGGPGVGAGYHNLPEKTAESFIEREGRRMYRSGDYARWTSEGFVEILGRTDNQIKLRGLRIELGEVESALAAVDGVRDAVVKIAPINGIEHLCAYYTAESALDVADIRAKLGQSLATYMVPTAYLQLDALPLTPNGKVDLRSLPPAQLFRSGDTVAAENETEQAFCTIFSEVLGIEDIGATTSFFEAGGTSMMAIRVVVEAEKRGMQITYADVYANPTPRELSSLVNPALQGETGERYVPDSEVVDYDYSNIEELLSHNSMLGFSGGQTRPLGNILLTGAVGYLGVHILHEFLERFEGTAYCLLRGRGGIPAEQRLIHQLFYYFERDYAPLVGSRIKVIEGDITLELPITNDMQIDTVINCAALVKHFSAGTEIEDVNVGGPANLVEFCLARDIPFVQISTGSTMKCALVPGANVVGKTTERQLYVGQDLQNKYVRSKFLAERLVLDAVATRGLKAKIMRVGNLAPRASDGEFQINSGTNAAMGRLKSFAMLGCASYDQLDLTMEFSPIDQTAHAILLLAQTPAPCVVFHPFNHHKVFMGDIFEAMRLCGLPVRAVERTEFASVLAEAENDPQKAEVLTSMLAYARKPSGEPAVVPQVGNDYTMQVLYRMGFRWDVTSIDYVERFVDLLEGFGFFDPES